MTTLPGAVLRAATLWLVALLWLVPFVAHHAGAQTLPNGFVRLSDVAPHIAQDIRYAGAFNFTGAPVVGYDAAECILTRPTATRLTAVEADLAAQGYGLVVYDCYRPRRSVARFISWSQGRGGPDMGPQFFPGLRRGDLIAMGYIARRSAHSNGTTVDVGLKRRDEALRPTPGGPCDGPMPRRGDTSVDLGTTFDCFSPRSATNAAVGQTARTNRARLASAMSAQGFTGYSAEWWHFRQTDYPAGQAMDFPVR